MHRIRTFAFVSALAAVVVAGAGTAAWATHMTAGCGTDVREAEPVIIQSGTVNTINHDNYCGHRIEVYNHPVSGAPTTVNFTSTARFGEDLADVPAPFDPKSVLIFGSSSVNITGSIVEGLTLAAENSNLVINSGTFSRDIEAMDTAFMEIKGGTLDDDIEARGNARVLLRGVTTLGGDIEARDSLGTGTAWLQIYGSNFQVQGVNANAGNVALNSFDLSGNLTLGGAFFAEAFRDPGATITLVTAASLGIDTDGDGDPDVIDNCPNKTNPLQEDYDLDEVGDACDDLRVSPIDVHSACRSNLLTCLSVTGDCEDGLDNDGDQQIDFPADTDCQSAIDPTEDVDPDCVDGVDNDGDGAIDLSDVGCSSAQDVSEKDQTGTWECDDFLSNEGGTFVDTAIGVQALSDDGLADMNDPGCGSDPEGQEAPECQDGIENDNDGSVDDDCGASSNFGACVKICTLATNHGLRCTTDANCGGQVGSCQNAPAEAHCSSFFDDKEKKSSRCGFGFELALALPALLALRRLRRGARA